MNDRPEEATNLCPFCKCEITIGARRCPHCSSNITDAVPTHGGMCPECKSTINDQALRCNRCKSWLVAYHTGTPTAMAASLAGDRPPLMLGSQYDEFGHVVDYDHFVGTWDPNPPPPRMVCTYADDWSTFDVRTKRLRVFEVCVDINGGSTRRRPHHDRVVTQSELDRWKIDNE